jgi:hypothetical protein
MPIQPTHASPLLPSLNNRNNPLWRRMILHVHPRKQRLPFRFQHHTTGSNTGTNHA